MHEREQYEYARGYNEHPQCYGLERKWVHDDDRYAEGQQHERNPGDGSRVGELRHA